MRATLSLVGEGQCGTGEYSSKRNKRKSGEPGGGSENKGQKSPKRMKIVAETQSRRRVAKEKIQGKLQTNFAAVRRILIEDQDQQKSDQDQKKSVKRRRKMKNVALHCFNYSGKGKGKGKVGKGKGGKGKGKGKGQFVV
jgi:hypothetical protein